MEVAKNVYGSSTNAKDTFTTLAMSNNVAGAGQNIQQNSQINCWGMGDCAQYSDNISYAGGDIGGDEGTGFNDVSYVQQQGNLVQVAILSTAASHCSTSLVGRTIASVIPQSVLVVSTLNCKVGDHLTIDRAPASGFPNAEDIEVLGFQGSSITAVYRCNHSSGALVEPSIVLVLDSSYQFGQDRVLVNLSTLTYSTGRVTSISGGGFIGTTTAWSASMVGGDVINPGVIALSTDDYHGNPFSIANPLKSWYQIKIIASPTLLGIHHFSVAGDGAYEGNGPGNGNYIVRPGARALRIVSNTVYLEANTFPWTAGDNVELAICPYPDVHGHLEQFIGYTPGGSYRSAYDFRNVGARTFQQGIYLGFGGDIGYAMDADSVAWGLGFSVDRAGTGYNTGPTQSGISYLAQANQTGSGFFGSKYAGLKFQGGALTGGLFGNADTGQLLFGNGNSTDTATTSLYTDAIALGNSFPAWGLKTNLILYGDGGGAGGPIVLAKSSNQRNYRTWYGSPNSPAGADSVLYSKDISGSGWLNFWSWGDAAGRFYRAQPSGLTNLSAMFMEINDPTQTVSPATNQGSSLNCEDTLVWDGSQAKSRPWCTGTDTDYTGNNAHSEWDLMGLSQELFYGNSTPYTFLKSNDLGILSFGKDSTFYGIHKLAQLDASGLTQNRHFSFQDSSGTVALLESTQTVIAPQTFTSSMTILNRVTIEATPDTTNDSILDLNVKDNGTDHFGGFNILGIDAGVKPFFSFSNVPDSVYYGDMEAESDHALLFYSPTRIDLNLAVSVPATGLVGIRTFDPSCGFDVADGSITNRGANNGIYVVDPGSVSAAAFEARESSISVRDYTLVFDTVPASVGQKLGVTAINGNYVHIGGVGDQSGSGSGGSGLPLPNGDTSYTQREASPTITGSWTFGGTSTTLSSVNIASMTVRLRGTVVLATATVALNQDLPLQLGPGQGTGFGNNGGSFNEIDLYVGGAIQGTITNGSWNVNSAAKINNSNGSASLPSYSFSNCTGCGLALNSGNKDVSMNTNGAEREKWYTGGGVIVNSSITASNPVDIAVLAKGSMTATGVITSTSGFIGGPSTFTALNIGPRSIISSTWSARACDGMSMIYSTGSIAANTTLTITASDPGLGGTAICAPTVGPIFLTDITTQGPGLKSVTGLPASFTIKNEDIANTQGYWTEFWIK